jgi:uroporphyrinogen-III synthase
MKSVLLTRPTMFSESLAALLEDLGYRTIVEPILTIEPRQNARPDADPPGAVMLTSRNAVAMLHNRRDEVLDLLDLPCFCVGIRTADSARSFGFRHVYEGRGDSMALARKIIQVMPPLTPLLHIVGEDRATAAGELLVRSGFVVDNWTVYKARPAEALSLSLQAALAQGDIGTALFFSPRTASAFAKLVDKHELQDACAKLTVVGLSQSALSALGALRFARKAVAAAPTEASLIARLQEVYPVAVAMAL